MKNMSKRVRRNMSLAKIEEQCPYCSSTKIWAAKKNVGKKCVGCKRVIEHKIVQTPDKYNRLYNKLVTLK